MIKIVTNDEITRVKDNYYHYDHHIGNNRVVVLATPRVVKMSYQHISGPCQMGHDNGGHCCTSGHQPH